MSAVMPGEAVISKATFFKERFIYGLVFLYPIAGVGVRHWYSGIFSILVLISLWDLIKSGIQTPLFREEKIWLWLCAAFFLTFLLSGVANGWTERQSHYLGTDLRYLAVVPLYLMLRLYPKALHYLLAGLMLAAVFIAAQAYHDIVMLKEARAEGEYSPNLIGPVAALIAVWLLASWRHWPRLHWLIPLLVVMALWALAMSGSRGGYLGAIIMGVVWGLLYVHGWRKVVPIIFILVMPIVLYYASDHISKRVDQAVTQVDTYFERMEKGEHYVTGTAVRFEMWRVAWMAFKDNPVLGVGRGNYTEAVKQYIGVDGVPKTVAQHGHAHNAYIDTLMSRGLVGFAVFMGMLFYPLSIFLRTRQASPMTALLGILHITGFAVFSITDASTFIKGNFITLFLLCMTIFLSSHLAQVYKKAA
jgi:O-antigen ligase